MTGSHNSKSKIQNTGFTLGFSPCPNDTFIFDAMVHGKVDTEGLDFNFILDDVDNLNKKTQNSELDITKISFFAYASAFKNYQLLDAGSALGFGCGPLLISKEKIRYEDMPAKKIAVPGQSTTANFLMSFAFPDAKKKTPLLFSEIEEAVLSGEYDAGVIIHENRFTYEQKGLIKIADLGKTWEQQTGMPIPLGGIAVRRSLPEDLKLQIQDIVTRSVEFALQYPSSSNDFVCKNAQAMDADVIRKHIELYVNDFSVSLGNKGKEAIKFLYRKAYELNLIEKEPQDIFV
jgi:1,4-dihydroxy-6-naphthoate synthase